MQNEKFYPAIEKKNHYEVSVDYIQGTIIHTKRKSVCEGKVLKGIKTWEGQNPDYKTEEEWNNLICKSPSQRLKIITFSELVWDK